MNAPEHRKRNRRLGIILSLLFVALFIIATRVMITGSKVPPTVEGAMESIKTPVLGIIGAFLVLVAVIEIVLRIVKRRVRENGAE
ncbi:hypothetical protein F4Y59_05540 [Candidatus Poribacteria bacterium]|nr:hypothetical protein [Candidatus Poribacteria bacterium]MXY27610.1 hypothetical protein [Candidatus Poribacteria bacterium]MYK18401.1 hypothetical protein [Candidatus Poribacteria bacterium]